MKKIIALVLTLTLVLSMGTVSAFAAAITTGTGTDSSNVTGSYVAGSSSTTVYSVDVTWGAMNFTYTAGSEGTWNPETHAYGNAGSGSWSGSGNTVAVTNHSNAAVTATLSYAAETDFSAITGSFTESSGTANDGILTLATAVGTTVANAPNASATMNLSGALASGTAGNTKIGTVTVTLS